MWSKLTKWMDKRRAIRDDLLESLLHAHHLQPGHYYLFIYDCRSISQSMSHAVKAMLEEQGIKTGFLRIRGIPPVVYDLKRPEEPEKGVGINHE